MILSSLSDLFFLPSVFSLQLCSGTLGSTIDQIHFKQLWSYFLPSAFKYQNWWQCLWASFYISPTPLSKLNQDLSSTLIWARGITIFMVWLFTCRHWANLRARCLPSTRPQQAVQIGHGMGSRQDKTRQEVWDPTWLPTHWAWPWESLFTTLSPVCLFVKCFHGAIFSTEARLTMLWRYEVTGKEKGQVNGF